jgi:hypothetical protein
MDCCDDEPCRTVRGGPFSLPEKRNSIPGSSSGRLQPVPLGDVTNANPSLRAPPDRASRPAAAAVTGASQSDGPKWIIPGIWKWTSPEEKKDHRAAREIGWTEKRQKGWSDNFTEEERELVHRRFDAEDVLDAIFKSPVCRKSFEKEWGDVTTVYIQRIVDQSREANHPKNAACANIIQGNFLAAFDCCLNPVLEAFGRDRITSPCALDATVEYLREHLDPKNPRIIHGISVCARGGEGGRSSRTTLTRRPNMLRSIAPSKRRLLALFSSIYHATRLPARHKLFRSIIAGGARRVVSGSPDDF